jgi:PAS domain S-box-containing protein
MNRQAKAANFYYRISVAFIGVLTLFASSFVLPWANAEWFQVGITTLFVAFLVNFPLVLLLSEVNLVPVVCLGSGLLYGPLPAAWATLVGILFGFFVRRIRQGWGLRRSLLAPSKWLEPGFVFGVNAIPLFVILPLMGWANGSQIDTLPPGQVWLRGTLPVLLFALLYVFLFLGEFYLRRLREYPAIRRDLISLGLIVVLPLPFILISVQAYPSIGLGSLVATAGVPSIIAVLVHGINAARIDLERRVQELSTLNQVSRTLRSTLDLQDLLPAIQEQVTSLLGADSFYVALYDKDTEELWYPLAVKFGERQEWPRRSVSDRLTDRVIKEGKPILLTPGAQSELSPVGLPPSEDTPTSWLGVPLIASERPIGCLAVFEVHDGVIFTPEDSNLLTILSGQVSVAIENALLYNQTQYRATQLETLNRLTGLITASLEPQEVLSQVCQSVALVGGGQRSAVFLQDPGEEMVWLAYAHGLPEGFEIRNKQFSIVQSRRTRCMRTGRPVIVPDVRSSSLALEVVHLFQADEIWAFADFPLIAPEGQIGFLSVFYDTPHAFHLEEVELLQTFASQVAMAVSNARLYARTDAALARRVQQLAILEAVGREISAAIHSARLFSLVLDYASEYTNAISGSVDIYESDGGILEVKASYGYPQEMVSFPADQGIVGRVVRTKQIANVPDVSQDPDFFDLREGETRSQLSVPILHGERVLGVITLESSEINAFSQNDQAFVVQLANQASVALLNAELYRETQSRLREQSTHYKISNRLVGALELGQVTTILCQAMAAALQTTVTGIYLWEVDQSHYRLISSEKTQELSQHLPSKIQEGDLLPFTAQINQGDLIHLLPDHPELKTLFGELDSCQVYIFPMVSAGHRLGLFILHLSEASIVSEEELQLLQAVVSQGAIALQNAYYYSDAMDGRERLSAVINSVGEGIMMIGTDGRVLLANEPIRTFTGLSLDGLINQKLQSLSADMLLAFGYSHSDISIMLDDLGREQVLVSPKTTYKVPDVLPKRVVERVTSPVWGGGGRVIGWMIVLRDITEEYEISEARETITQTLVHDLRSPMSAVMGSLDFMDEELSADSRDPVIDQSLRVATRSAHRVLALIESLLDIARLQSGRMEINLENLNLSEIVDDLMIDFTTQANEYGIILRNEIPSDLPVIRADRDKVMRIFANLVENAIKFTPVGGYIRVSAVAVEDRLVEVRVQDTGPGVPPEYQEKIFERFAQVPGQRGRTRGSGLGLTFCRLAVEAHGGRIWVESPPDDGSVFHFTLPVSH